MKNEKIFYKSQLDRIKFIDIARAFAIIFIVLGHTLVHSANCWLVFKFLYSFHVFFFFILSGYTFNYKEESFAIFFKRKFFRIMIPYFIWSLLFLIPYILLGENVGASLGTTSSFDVKNQIFNIVYGNGNLSALKQNSSLWFLPALFSMEIVYFLIIKIINRFKKAELPFLIILIFLGYFSTFIPIVFPWGINTVLNIGFFFLIGYILKKYNLLNKNRLFKLPYMILILVVGLYTCFINVDSVSCIDYSYGNFIFALFSGLFLSLFFLYISYLLNTNKVLEYIGKNTMGVLIFHKIIILVCQTKLGIVSQFLKKSNIFIECGLSFLIVIVSILFSLIIAWIIKRIFPFLLGEKKNSL